jgi:cellobiose-specific phosphotransferase system component IIC
MPSTNVWETANGVLAILGLLITIMVSVYLARNFRRTYHEPVRLITLAFLAVIFGHTIKDSAAYLARCCDVMPSDAVIILAVTLVGLGKLGCILIWSDPRWGLWPWIIAVGAVGAFLVFA